MGFHLDDDKEDGGDDSWEQQVPVKKRRRWDSQPEISNIGDALDKFMEKLEADDTVTTQETSLSIDISQGNQSQQLKFNQTFYVD